MCHLPLTPAAMLPAPSSMLLLRMLTRMAMAMRTMARCVAACDMASSARLAHAAKPSLAQHA